MARRNAQTEPYTQDECRIVAMNMMKFGGSFVKGLGGALLHADAMNRRKLQITFEDYFDTYFKM